MLVNDCRMEMFSRGRQVQSIPPTQDALQQHIQRASLQAMIWVQSMEPSQRSPDPQGWGLKNVDGQWEPRWTSLPEASKDSRILVKCGCKGPCGDKRACSCKKSFPTCTFLCSCPCYEKERQEWESSWTETQIGDANEEDDEEYIENEGL